MATEEKKQQNQLRLTNMALVGITAGVWQTLGDSAFALSGPMGNQILEMMEKEMGLEVAGESPQTVITEIARIFVDEFGFASDIQVETQGDDGLRLKVCECVNRTFTDKLVEAGVEKPFICPIMNACQAALRRMGYKMREDVVKWVEGKGSIITFEAI